MENIRNIVHDMSDINQMKPETIKRLTSQVSAISSSMFDLSSLSKSSHLSVSSPSLAGSGLFSKKKKSKVATSKTHLLKSSDGLDNAAFQEDCQVRGDGLCSCWWLEFVFLSVWTVSVLLLLFQLTNYINLVNHISNIGFL